MWVPRRPKFPHHKKKKEKKRESKKCLVFATHKLIASGWCRILRTIYPYKPPWAQLTLYLRFHRAGFGLATTWSRHMELVTPSGQHAAEEVLRL